MNDGQMVVSLNVNSLPHSIRFTLYGRPSRLGLKVKRFLLFRY